MLVQLCRVALVLLLNGGGGQDSLGRQVGYALLIPARVHDFELRGRPGVHGNGSHEGDVHAQRPGILCVWCGRCQMMK